MTSLLTLYATMKVWNLAFWRAPKLADPHAPPGLSPIMVGATLALVALGIGLTVVAGPLYQLSGDAAEDLRQRTPYVEAVFPVGQP